MGKHKFNSDDIDPETLFARVKNAYDTGLLKRTRIIIVGTGGSVSFIEDITRTGISEVVVVDPDCVEAANIATQQAYVSDIGTPKVEALSKRLSLINPEARISISYCSLGEISDEEFSDIAFSPFMLRSKYGPGTPKPLITLLCGMTDDFYAQARVNRLSLKFSLPSLCCQLYKEGRAGEITFTYPGVTPACHRCILVNRYKAYLENGYQNDVTSEGAPIFATSRINSLCGTLAMALIHHGTGHERFGDALSAIGNKNLIQLRLHPQCGLSVFDQMFASADRAHLLFDEPVWLEQEPLLNCPDCRGTGNLRDARGKFADTTCDL